MKTLIVLFNIIISGTCLAEVSNLQGLIADATKSERELSAAMMALASGQRVPATESAEVDLLSAPQIASLDMEILLRPAEAP